MANFHDTLTKIKLTPKIPDFCFTLSPIIKPQSGLQRIEDALKNIIAEDDHTWAKEARVRWNHDLDLLNRFMKKVMNFPKAMKLKSKHCKNNMNPVLQCKLLTVDSFMLPRIIFYRKSPFYFRRSFLSYPLSPLRSCCFALPCVLIRTILCTHMISISWKIFF